MSQTLTDDSLACFWADLLVGLPVFQVIILVHLPSLLCCAAMRSKNMRAFCVSSITVLLRQKVILANVASLNVLRS